MHQEVEDRLRVRAGRREHRGARAVLVHEELPVRSDPVYVYFGDAGHRVQDGRLDHDYLPLTRYLSHIL